MTPEPKSLQRPRPQGAAGLLVFACLVLGVKLLLIARYGSAIPLWDQWQAESRGLYLPLLNGTLQWGDLLAGYNGHRIVMTRLLDLALLDMNGQVWNPLLQQAVNAVLHVLGLTLALHYLLRASRPEHRNMLLVFATILFCIPFGYANTLWGFQSQVYFVLLFSILHLWSMSQHRPLSGPWWLGLCCGGLAALSFGSGASTLVVGAALLLLRWLRGIDSGWRAITATYLTAILAMVAVASTPVGSSTFISYASDSPLQQLMVMLGRAPATPQVLSYGSPQAGSAREFLEAFLSVASWPAFCLAPLLQYPLLRFLWRQLRHPPGTEDASWFAFALGAWSIVQMLLLAFARAKAPLSSRYTDFYTIGLLAGCYSLLQMRSIAEETLLRKWRWQNGFTGIWLATLGLAMLIQLREQFVLLETVFTPPLRAAEQQVAVYLSTGNTALLDSISGLESPISPDRNMTKRTLDNAATRQLLPPELVPANAARQTVFTSLLVRKLSSIGMALLAVAILLACGGLARKSPFISRHGPGADSPP